MGDSVELAPRAPDPDAPYSWRVISRPDNSTTAVGNTPVIHLTPDVPGVYRVALDGPDGTHTQTVRAVSDPRKTAQFCVSTDAVARDINGTNPPSVIGQFNDFTMGSHFAQSTDNTWKLDVSLPPGEHEAIFVFDDSFESCVSTTTTVSGPGRPRLRLDGHRDGDTIIVSATTVTAPGGTEPDVEFYLDDRDELSDTAVTIDGSALRVSADALPSLARIHAVAIGERHSIADTLIIHDAVSFERPADPPEWIHDAVIYEIFVREFAGPDVDTTFEAIERRVPYLEWLGVDAVWLTPVVESPTRHGYHITNFFDTASDLGSRREFQSLIDRFHAADIRVIFDLVLNHTSRDHPSFQLHRAGVPAYDAHYERVPDASDTSSVNWSGDDAPGYYFNWTRIPNLNYDSLPVRDWMLSVVDEWAPLVDGFRCDVAWGVPHGFWKELRDRLKARDTDFVLLDETVPRDPAFRENEFDVHYDTDLYSQLRAIGTGSEPAPTLFDALAASRRQGYPSEALHMRYVENHDEERYSTECTAGALRAAVAATLTLPGVPMIYYGQERGVTDQRGPMRWHDGDAALTAFHRRLIALRTEHSALRSAGVERVDCSTISGDPNRIVAYERSDETETLLVVLNFGQSPATVALSQSTESTDLITGSTVRTDDGIHLSDVVILQAR